VGCAHEGKCSCIKDADCKARDDDDTVGVVFRYKNSGQFYLLFLRHAAALLCVL
jgi:hypothetical protein